MQKKEALFVMQRRAVADAFAEYARSAERFTVTIEQRYALAALTAETHAPAVVLMEIPESGPWKSADKCLAICDVIRRQAADCSILLLCPENDAEACGKVIAAKRARRIDDFLYYETSMEYLFSKLGSFAE